jgi:uncharacterized protein YjbI with pentapeptide repeats
MIEIKERLTGKLLLRVRADTLTNADLHGAKLRNADLGFQSLAGANLNNANLADAELVKADLAGASLRGARLERAHLDSSNLTGAVMAQAKLAHADLLRACLIKADLTGAVMTDAMLAGAEFTDAIMVDADLTRANLTKANLAGANLEGARLTKAVFKGARFDGRTRWPANFEPEQYGATRLEKVKEQTVYPECRIRLIAASPEDGAAEHLVNAGGSKLGGLPGWIQNDETPSCPDCAQPMDFVGQIDSIGCANQTQSPSTDPTLLTRAALAALSLSSFVFSDCGMIYVFYCGDCSEVEAVLQFH